MVHRHWELDESQLEGLDCVRARQLIEACFLAAQRETLERAQAAVGQRGDLEGQVRTMMRLAFRQVGGDYDQPDCTSLTRVVEALAAKAGAWGTPDDVIAHHAGQIRRVLERLAAA